MKYAEKGLEADSDPVVKLILSGMVQGSFLGALIAVDVVALVLDIIILRETKG